MLSFAIVEDEAHYAQQLEEYLRRYAAEQGEAVEITHFADGEDIVAGYRSQFDVILLDVQMKFMDGITTAQYIREKDAEVIILFITNMAQYAIKGYEVDALDYVLKPVSYFAFSQRLDRALTRMRHRRGAYVIVHAEGGLQRLSTSTLYYVESSGHELLYHTGKEVITATGTLREAEEKLTPHHFFRCNKGQLVNLEHVEAVRDGCAVVHGEKIVISRARRADLMAALTNYMGETIK